MVLVVREGILRRGESLSLEVGRAHFLGSVAFAEVSVLLVAWSMAWTEMIHSGVGGLGFCGAAG